MSLVTQKPNVKAFFDPMTWTLTYVVWDPETKDAVILDPVWDYEPASATLSLENAKIVLNWVRKQDFKVHYILETHAHADHLSGSQFLKAQIPGAKVGIGARITEVQKVFQQVFHLESDFKADGSQFDLLLKEGEPLRAGRLEIKTLFTPGHTPACATYVIGDAVFTGDVLFMPDSGTGRCDFPAGSASDLFDSIQKIFALPDSYRVFVGHDYQPQGRPLAYESSIREEKQNNIHINAQTRRENYVEFRQGRDRTLSAPKLLLPSVQVNIRAGRLPPAEENGVSYLKIPVQTESAN